MSATNPFRRKPQPEAARNPSFDRNDPPTSSKQDPTVPPIDTALPRTVKAKTVKTVRIISPHSADSEPEELVSDSSPESYRRPLFSPPPASSPPIHAENDGSLDPFSGGSEEAESGPEDEITRQNTLQNVRYNENKSSPISPYGVPSNPFKKTLASIEPTVSRESNLPEASQSSLQEGIVQAKPHYDVDDFKRLLLTGEKSAVTASSSKAPTISFGHPFNGDSSSNTDASSISRHSLFEPPNSLLTESPRTSREPSPSEDDQQRLVGPPARPEKVKPSTPRHRHGKLVKANAPQTVSFEDPALSFHSSKSTAVNDDGSGSPLPPGNKEKPLPALPDPPAPRNLGSTAGGIIESENPASNENVEAAFQSQKRVPPPPPAARRSGQNRPISIANSAASIDKGFIEPSPIISNPQPDMSNPKQSLPRQTGAFRGESSSSIPTLTSAASSSDYSIGQESPYNPPKSRPPVPPTRSPTVSATKSSHHSSPASGSPARVPPQPPPRRRGSSQSSYTPSRLSGDYRNVMTERLRSDSGASSISHLAMTPLETTSEKKDVMSDLTTLQREVDELRGKMAE